MFELIACVFEKGTLDLSAMLVHKFDVEEVAFRPGVLPALALVLFNQSSFDSPVVVEGT